MSHSLSEEEARLLYLDLHKVSAEEFDKKLEEYVKKAVLDVLIAEWKPFITAVKWILCLILTGFGVAFVGIVFEFLKRP